MSAAPWRAKPGEVVMRAMLVHGGALGDFVLSLRVVGALRAAGASHVAVLGRPGVARFALELGAIDELLDLETGGFHRVFAATGASDEDDTARSVRLRLSGRDLVVNMLPGRAGGNGALAEWFGGARVVEVDPRPRPGLETHITEQWLGDLRAAGLDLPEAAARPGGRGWSGEFRMRLERMWSKRREFAEGGPGWLAISPGSGSRAKCWPRDRFVRVLELARAEGWKTAVVLGPVEAEWYAATQVQAFERLAVVLREMSSGELAGYLAAANAYLGNDSGVTHLAAWTGTPTVAIFGPTDPRVWRPLGCAVRVFHEPAGDENWPRAEAVWTALRAWMDDGAIA